MKLKKLVITTLGALSATALVGSAGAAVVTSDPGVDADGVSFADATANSAVSGGSGPGTIASPFAFDVSVLGKCAILEIRSLDTDIAPSPLYLESIVLEIDITNNWNRGPGASAWNNVFLELGTGILDTPADELYPCVVPSPNDDQFSFAQNEGAGLRPPTLDVGNTLLIDEDGERDFLDFELDTPLALGGTVKARFAITNGSILGGPLTEPLYLLITVPEPSSAALLGLGVLGFFLRRKRA